MPHSKYELLLRNIKDISEHGTVGNAFAQLASSETINFGLTMTWSEAMLSADKATFDIQLRLLTNDYLNHPAPYNGTSINRLSEVIKIAEEIVKNNSSSHNDLREYRSLNKFLHRIVKYQPGCYSETLQYLHNACYCGNRDYYQEILPKLFNTISQFQDKKPIVFLLSSVTNTIAIFTDMRTHYQYFDASLLEYKPFFKEDYSNFNDLEYLVDQIFNSLPTGQAPTELLAINITAFYKPEPSQTMPDPVDYQLHVNNLAHDNDIPSSERPIKTVDDYISCILHWYRNNPRLRHDSQQKFLHAFDKIMGAFNVGYHQNALTKIISSGKHLQSDFIRLAIRHHNLTTILRLLLIEDANEKIILTEEVKYSLLCLVLDNPYYRPFLSLINQYPPLLDLNKPNQHAENFLNWLCRYGSADVLKWFLNANVIYPNLAHTPKKGISVAHFACKHGRLDMMEVLFARNMRFDQYTEENLLPLHYACQYGYSEIVKFLFNDWVRVRYPITVEDFSLAQRLARQHRRDSILEVLQLYAPAYRQSKWSYLNSIR